MWVWLGLVWARYFAPSLPSAAAAAAPAEAPGARAGAIPRAGAVIGAAVGAAARLAGAAVSGPCAPGAPSGGGAAGLTPWAAGAVSSAGEGPWGDGSVSAGGRPGLPSWQPDRHRCVRQPLLLALRECLPRASWGDKGAGARPAVVPIVPLGGAIGVRHHCYPGRHA